MTTEIHGPHHHLRPGKNTTPIEVLCGPGYDDPDADITFDANGTPFLTYGEHPQYGLGWRLWYLEDPDDDNTGVEEHFFTDAGDDVDAAIASARQWLEIRADARSWRLRQAEELIALHGLAEMEA